MSKNMIITAVIVVVVLVGGALLMSQNQSQQPASQPTPTTTTESAAPTGAEESKEATGAMEKEEGAIAKTIVEVKNFTYTPATLTVKAGEKITFTNRDVAGHSMTSDDGKSFDSAVMGKDQTTTVTAPTKPGTYAFHCTPHPSIKGTLIVQ